MSLSRLIKNYLDFLTKEQENDFEISPFVKSIPTDVDYLDEKYK